MSLRSGARPSSINTEFSGTFSRGSVSSGDSTPYDLVTPRDSGHARLSFGDVPMSPKKKLLSLSGAPGLVSHFSLNSPPKGAQEQTPDDVQRAVKSAAKTLPFTPNSSRKRPQSLSVDELSGLIHSGKKGSLDHMDALDDDASADDSICSVAGQLFCSVDSDSPTSDATMLCNESCSFDDDVPSRGSIGGRKLLAENSLTRTMSCNFGFCDHFYWLKKLGSGSFSHVWLCEHKQNGEFFAVKADQRPLKGVRDRDLHLREINAVIEIGQHEYIVQYFRSWQEDRFFFSQMEFCEYGCLQQLCAKQALALGVGGRDWPVIGRIVHDTISGLAAIHSHNLLHLDIKPGIALLHSAARTTLSHFSLSSPQATYSSAPPVSSKSAILVSVFALLPGKMRKATANILRASFWKTKRVLIAIFFLLVSLFWSSFSKRPRPKMATSGTQFEMASSRFPRAPPSLCAFYCCACCIRTGTCALLVPTFSRASFCRNLTLV